MTNAAEALVQDCANRLDQLFRQDYTMREVEAELRRLLRATQSNGIVDDWKAAAKYSADCHAAEAEREFSQRQVESPAPSAPAQEPVAWRYLYHDPHGSDMRIWHNSSNWNGMTPIESQPLYAASPQSAPAQEPAYILDPRNGRWDYRHPGMSKAIHELYAYAAPQPDEAVALLRALEPHLDKLICYASTTDEYEPNAIVARIRAYLKDRT